MMPLIATHLSQTLTSREGGREEAIRLDRLAGPDNDMKGLSSCNKLTHNFEVGQ